MDKIDLGEKIVMVLVLVFMVAVIAFDLTVKRARVAHVDAGPMTVQPSDSFERDHDRPDYP